MCSDDINLLLIWKPTVTLICKATVAVVQCVLQHSMVTLKCYLSLWMALAKATTTEHVNQSAAGGGGLEMVDKALTKYMCDPMTRYDEDFIMLQLVVGEEYQKYS